MLVIEQGGINWWVVGILFAEVVLLFVLATPDNANTARAAEERGALIVFGEQKAQRARDFAQRNFGRQLVDTRVVDRSHDILIPTPESRERAGRVGEMTPALFVWVKERLDGFWSMVYGVYHRLALMGFALMVCIPVIWTALIDGLVGRKIGIYTDNVATPVYYHGAKKAFGVVITLPLFLLLLPIGLSPMVWYAWLLLLPCVIWVSSRNVQEL